MDFLCGKLWMSFIILPVTAGNYRRRPNGYRYYDCSISSRVLILIFFALVIGLTVSNRLPTHAETRFVVVLILLSMIMICGIIIVCSLGCLVRRHGLHSVVTTKRHAHTRKLQMIFIWIFGLSSALYCVLFVGKQIECLNTHGGLCWNVLFCFNIILILSLFMDIIFISYFSPYELKHSTAINYAMFLLITANISVILYIYLMKNTFLYLMEMNHGSQLRHCLENNSTMTVLLHTAKPFVDPTFVEFALLSITILLEIWSPKQAYNSDNGLSAYTETNFGAESQPLLNSVRVTEPQYSEIRGRRTLHQMVSLAVSITVGLGLIACYVIITLGIGDGYRIQYLVQIYELTMKTTMIVATFVGFFCLVQYCTPDESTKGLKSRDYVYLLSAFGLFMSHIWKAIGADVSPDQNAKLIFFTNVFSTFQDYLQVVFLLYANRCKKSDPRSNVNLLESILIFIMISNFVFWFTDSFFISTAHTMKHDHLPKELLRFVHDIFLPMCIFFRFTSFLEYYTTFGKFNS
ncbi:uncharacterized protein LOC117333767 [Pecten maximus]|uniref:uncharacterized protein LOC117333767 n=1 Tax=Pecten maximus TaxID=6579 RepID=UPI001458ECB2|nr:uncharacterized protein LOC117333767 [Pecten maximus]